jgi:predicted enzyme related to lactoylglutathione lyase
MKMNPVVHFEMPAENRERMADFYSKVFGWKPQFFGEDMGNYVTVRTSESDENGFPVRPGSINGGFYLKNSGMPNNCPSLVIAVDDINEHIKKVTGGGGSVIGEPVDIPGVGRYVSFRDTEGNVCSLLQPVMMENQKQPEKEQQTVESREYGMTGEI